MRRLIEGLDELAGHDVVIARGDLSQGQRTSGPGLKRLRAWFGGQKGAPMASLVASDRKTFDGWRQDARP